jgi:hypothetical protein
MTGIFFRQVTALGVVTGNQKIKEIKPFFRLF